MVTKTKVIVPSDITITTEDAVATIAVLRKAHEYLNRMRTPYFSSTTEVINDCEVYANTLQDYIDAATEANEPDPDEKRGEIPMPSAGSLEVEGLNGMAMPIEEEEEE